MQQLQATGMAYVKVPDSIIDNLKIVRETALTFFHQTEDYKRQYPFDQRNGYINHRDTKSYTRSE